MAISIYFLLFLIPEVASITFDMTNITQQNQNQIVTSGVASLTAAGIQLTDERLGAAGRATYNRSLHLWDKSSTELASFSTNFSFVIEPRVFYGDGFTFFLAADNSVITEASALGLPIDNITFANTDPVVAVEFDTYWNGGVDPENISGLHVGIDVNSVFSSKYKQWSINITEGANCQAQIKYDSMLKNLTVSVTDTEYGVIGLDYIIDFRRLLPEWVIFGFTASTGGWSEKVTVTSWTFNSSSIQVNEMEAQPLKEKNKTTGLTVGLITGPLVVLTFLAMCAFCLWRNKNKRDEYMNKDFELGTGPKRFSYHKIVQATAGFADTNKLGEGGFGGVYKGFMKDLGTYVAVKRLSKKSKQGIKEYASEVKTISQLRHKNLVELKGWCHEKEELLLVYDFMKNGSLDHHLLKRKSLLAWDTRYKIATGLAAVLHYLHHEWEQCVLHRDIKSSNVMLDSNFNAKLGDFGLAKLVDHEKGSKTTNVAGTFGYLAPECEVTGKASRESDVYSFGVVALEIACGRKPIEQIAPEKQTHLIKWVWELYETNSLLDAVDPHLETNFEEEEFKRLAIVGLWCVHPNAEHRPSMTQVYHVLNSDASLPIPPSRTLVPSYMTSPSTSLTGHISSNQTTITSLVGR